jgi:hypothetical protein
MIVTVGVRDHRAALVLPHSSYLRCIARLADGVGCYASHACQQGRTIFRTATKLRQAPMAAAMAFVLLRVNAISFVYTESQDKSQSKCMAPACLRRAQCSSAAESGEMVGTSDFFRLLSPCFDRRRVLLEPRCGKCCLRVLRLFFFHLWLGQRCHRCRNSGIMKLEVPDESRHPGFACADRGTSSSGC